MVLFQVECLDTPPSKATGPLFFNARTQFPTNHEDPLKVFRASDGLGPRVVNHEQPASSSARTAVGEWALFGVGSPNLVAWLRSPSQYANSTQIPTNHERKRRPFDIDRSKASQSVIAVPTGTETGVNATQLRFADTPSKTARSFQAKSALASPCEHPSKSIWQLWLWPLRSHWEHPLQQIRQ